MIKAETLKDIVCTLGQDCVTKVGNGEIHAKKLNTTITEAQRKVLKKQFMELEKAGKLLPTVPHDENDIYMLWNGCPGTEYQPLVISLFRDSVTIDWITKYSSE